MTILKIAETPDQLSPAARAYDRCNRAAVRLLDCERARLGYDPDLAADPTDPAGRALVAYGNAWAELNRHDAKAAGAMDESVTAAIRRLMKLHTCGMDQVPGFAFTGRPVA